MELAGYRSTTAGGVGIGYALHAGQVIVADGTEEAAQRLQRVLTTDPGMGAIRMSMPDMRKPRSSRKKAGVRIPMWEV